MGLAWSPVTCTCAPEQLIALETEERRERSGPGLRETFLSWQMVTIIVLLLLIFLLIITIFALISKLQTAKRRIKTAKLQASAQLTAARQGSEPLYDPLYSKSNNTPKMTSKLCPTSDFVLGFFPLVAPLVAQPPLAIKKRAPSAHKVPSRIEK